MELDEVFLVSNAAPRLNPLIASCNCDGQRGPFYDSGATTTAAPTLSSQYEQRDELRPLRLLRRKANAVAAYLVGFLYKSGCNSRAGGFGDRVKTRSSTIAIDWIEVAGCFAVENSFSGRSKPIESRISASKNCRWYTSTGIDAQMKDISDNRSAPPLPKIARESGRSWSFIGPRNRWWTKSTKEWNNLTASYWQFWQFQPI
jgi:hypothetical protein